MIFALERALPAMTSWPVFIFPVFVILFMLTRPPHSYMSVGASKNNAADLSYITIASLFFDFFSSFRFGFFTLTILAVSVSIYLFKIRFSVGSTSFFSTLIYSLIFVFEFFVLLSTKSNLQLVVTQIPIIIVETMTILLLTRVFFYVFGKIQNNQT